MVPYRFPGYDFATFSDPVPECNTPNWTFEMTAPRPVSVTILGWSLTAATFLAAAGVGFLVVTAPDLKSALTVLSVLGLPAVFHLVMAVGVLRGANWARILFLWLSPVSQALTYSYGKIEPGIILATVIYIVAAYILTRPAARAYYAGGGDPAVRGRNRLAYGTVAVLAVLSVINRFSFEISQWVIDTYKIGYVLHGAASLKLPDQWTPLPDDEQPAPSEWLLYTPAGYLEAVAWRGFPATGSVSFEPGYVRDSGTQQPCGLARFRLSFPDNSPDPLRQTLISRLKNASGQTNTHRYFESDGLQVLEFDETHHGGYRFLIWSWRRKSVPDTVMGLVLGVPARDEAQRNLCNTGDIVRHLSVNTENGADWTAGRPNGAKPGNAEAITPLFVDVNLTHLRRYGADPNTFGAWLRSKLDGNDGYTVKSLENMMFSTKTGAQFPLKDVARISSSASGGSFGDIWSRPVIARYDR